MRRSRISALFLAGLSLLAALRGQEVVVPAAEAANLPTQARLTALAQMAGAGGWGPVAGAASDAAYSAYAADRLNAAQAWNFIDRWASLFAEDERLFVARFIAAVEASKVSRSAMSFAPADRPLAGNLDAEMQRWLIANVKFSDEFFSMLSPLDYVPRVFSNLVEIRKAEPARFAEYASLALAIALVYDLPPAPDWPHGQVSPSALPRKFPGAGEAFSWWVREDRAGRTYQRLNRLGADELKFVVDVAAPFAELEWAQKGPGAGPLSALPTAYTMIKYRQDRLESNTGVWPGRTYALSEILREGGICVDQAYFATMVGKARGVPTLFFRGEGLDGRHAWFGFLDANQAWQLDAGRYAEQRYVTGVAYDPQTWKLLTDHDLKFLSERFRQLPAFQSSRIHAAIAARLLADGRLAEALVAARKAVNFEKRNLEAWETLIAAQQSQKQRPQAIEATLREAIIAFRAYPDLEIAFTNRVAASLRARGETSQADYEQTQLARKNQSTRTDLSFMQAAESLQRGFSRPLAEQIRAYNFVVDTYGRGQGIDFFDRVVVVFAEHLEVLGQPAEAQRAIDRARQVLKVEPGRQLDSELRALAVRVARPR